MGSTTAVTSPDLREASPDRRFSDRRCLCADHADEPVMAASSSSTSDDDPAKKPKRIVDVGRGIGGSSRYLANKYGAQCYDITLSPVQAQRGNALAAAQGLSDKVSFLVADALERPFPDGQFDLVWPMESGEHMPDKRKFVSELARVAAPGATIIIVTCCYRDLGPSEDLLKPDELNLLKRICDAYYHPDWCSPSDYVKIAKSLSRDYSAVVRYQDIRTADWSENVAPFWPAVIQSALTWKGLTSLLRSGLDLIRRMEDDKVGAGDAFDDSRLQERSHQVHHHHLSQTPSSIGGENPKQPLCVFCL